MKRKVTSCARSKGKKKNTQQILEYLLANSPAVHYICDLGAEWACTFVSENIVSQLGYYPKEFCGHPSFWEEHIHPDDLRHAIEGHSELLQKGYHVAEYRFLNKDGEYRWLRDESRLTHSANGHPMDCVGFLMDVSELKRVEEKLRQREADLAEAQRVARIGSWRLDITANTVTWSEELHQLFDVEQTVFGGTFETFINCVHPDDRARVLETNRRTRESGEPFEIAYRVVTGDGQVKYFRESGYAVRDSAGRVVGLFGTAQDITDRIHAEEELRLFRNLLDRAHDAIFVVEPETGRLIDANAKACSNLGYERDELLRLNIFDIQSNMPDTSSWEKYVDEVMNSGYTVLEGKNRRKDGTTFPVEVGVSYVSHERANYIVAVVRDITERMQSEKKLMESIARYKDLFDSTLDGVYQVNANGFFVRMNLAGARIFGHESPEEIIGRNALDYWRDPHDRDGFRAELKIKKKVSGYHMRAKRKDGEPLELESSSRMIEDEDGNFLGIEGILRDITERKRTDDRIQRQIERFSALRAIDLAISSSLDVRVTLQIFIEHVITQLGVDAVSVLLLDPHTRILEYAASQGFRTSALKHTHLRLGEGYAGTAAFENRLLNIPDLTREDTGFKRMHLLEGEDFVAYYAVPLVAKGHVKGVLEIFHRSPLQPDEEWFEFLNSLALQAAIAIDNNSLFLGLERSNMELAVAYDSTIEGWSRALDYRDKETEGHSQRVTELTLRIAREIGMTEEELVYVRRGALLHDIGKMGIPDSILLKPGALTEEEWKIMRLHPMYCYELLYPIPYLRTALDIPYCHHERWDGGGYPRGLKGEQIPLSARIFAVVDVWDALCSDRPYRRAWTPEKAKEHILSLSGIQFDPKVVEVFMRAIAERSDA